MIRVLRILFTEEIMQQESSRAESIVRVSYRGIGVNLLLVIGKAAVGLHAHSIAVVLDAVNNLSDAMSSLITIIGAKLAGKAADRKHPYGHGRIEYISASLIAVMIFVAGLASLKQSAEKLMHPVKPDYSAVSLLILAAGVAAKIILGQYYKKKGNALNSASLTASGTDALFDAVIGAATLISAAVSMTAGKNIEGLLGIVISVLILKAGFDIIRETMNHIIGIRADDALTAQIRQRICENPNVRGAYDLILHNYGPDKYFGTVHIEIDDHMTAREIDALSRSIVPQIYQEFGVLLTIGIYAANTHSETAQQIREAVRHIVSQYPEILQMHGFYAEEAVRAVSFDIMLDYDTEGTDTITEEIRRELTERFPDYQFFINIDRDFSD